MSKFIVTKTSDFEYGDIVNINSLEELLSFVRKNGDIIISERIEPVMQEDGKCRFEPSGKYMIEIYDTYRE